ncbi:energy transducer TonB [Hymenobacter sedentarius]|nr:energy transducer TonB [Hymenobacter sedentarius]
MSALLLAAASTVSAQDAVPSAAYDGPRFPGGPDSLRTFVYRSTRLAAPASDRQLVAQFELKGGQQPQNFKLLPPPRPFKAPLIKAGTAALGPLQAKMPNWAPGTPDPKATAEPKIFLPLDVSRPLASLPYAYADTNPVFPDAVALVPVSQTLSALDYSSHSLQHYIQRSTRYPAAALRQGQQGVVYAYFEVAETGAIEHTEIVGTAGDALDNEVLRALKTLPAATKPAMLQGRPVRVFYVVPLTFKMMMRGGA